MTAIFRNHILYIVFIWISIQNEFFIARFMFKFIRHILKRTKWSSILFTSFNVSLTFASISLLTLIHLFRASLSFLFNLFWMSFLSIQQIRFKLKSFLIHRTIESLSNWFSIVFTARKIITSRSFVNSNIRIWLKNANVEIKTTKTKKCLKTTMKKTKKNEKNNEKFKNKILKVVKIFLVENFDFIVKNAFMIAFRIFVFFVWIWNFDVSQYYCCDKFVFKFDIYIFITFYAVEDIDDIVKIVDENQIFLKCRDSNDHLIFFNIMTRYCLDVFVNFLFNYKLEEKKIDCQLFKKNVNIDKNDIIAHISSILVNFLILNLWISFIEFAFSAMKKSLLFFLRDDDADELALSNTKFVDISFDRFFFVFSDRKRKYNEKHIHEWHKRLTHSFRRIVFKIMKHSVVNFIKFFSNNDLCDTCVKTFFKQKFHDIFIVFNWFSNDFIHNDIEKSLKLNINENVVLYFIFMCDKIKRFKMYIINHKFQIYMCFKTFKKFVKYENCRIHRLKTNWEDEYQNYDFEIFRKKENIDWEFVILENSFANDAIERLKQIFIKQIFVMFDDVDFSLKKKYWSKTMKIVDYIKNRQFVIFLNHNFYKKSIDHHSKIEHFRFFDIYDWANQHHFYIDWKKLQSRAVICKLLDYKNDIIYRMLHFNESIFRIDKIKWFSLKRKVDFVSDEIFKRIKFDIIQKIVENVNKIFVSFNFKFKFAFVVRFKSSVYQFFFVFLASSKSILKTKKSFSNQRLTFKFLVLKFSFQEFFLSNFLCSNEIETSFLSNISNCRNEIFFLIFSFWWHSSWSFLIEQKRKNSKFTKKSWLMFITKWHENSLLLTKSNFSLKMTFDILWIVLFMTEFSIIAEFLNWKKISATKSFVIKRVE